MKQDSLLLLIGVLATAPAFGQRQWSMDDCIGYAVEHSVEVRKAQVEADARKSDLHHARLDFLPSVAASVSAQYSWGRNIDPETNTYNNVTTFNNYYQLYASVPLFDGMQTVNAFRKARLARRNAADHLQAAREEKAITVMGRYVDALYAGRSVALMEERLSDSQALLEKTRRQYELGEKSLPDVAQMESQVAEDDYNLLHQRHLALQTLLDLKREMAFPVADTLELAAYIYNNVSATDEPQATANAFLQRSPAVRNAHYEAESARLTWKQYQGALLPTLTVGAGISTNYYRNLRSGYAYDWFHSQFTNNMGEYVYATLSIPLFSASALKSERRAKAAYLTALLDEEDVARRQRDEVVKAVADRDGYRKELAQMHRKVTSDSLAYHLSRRKYEEGMLSTFDLHAASQTLATTRIKLLQTQMLLALKERLVAYYKGEMLWGN